MAEYIDLDENITVVDTMGRERETTARHILDINKGAYKTADVRPVVRGKWEPSGKYKGYVSCSICHDCYVLPEWVTKLKWDFCPNCGAKMEEG